MFNICYAYRYNLIEISLVLPTAMLNSIAASRLSMNIRAITVERGIATLAQQSRLLALSSRGSGNCNPDNAGAGATSGDDVLSEPAAGQEEEEEVDNDEG